MKKYKCTFIPQPQGWGDRTVFETDKLDPFFAKIAGKNPDVPMVVGSIGGDGYVIERI